MGVQLDALGWEDTLPGKGRPQGLINADLKNADLIVFVFWKRWGTPTGSFSSGPRCPIAEGIRVSYCDSRRSSNALRNWSSGTRAERVSYCDSRRAVPSLLRLR